MLVCAHNETIWLYSVDYLKQEYCRDFMWHNLCSWQFNNSHIPPHFKGTLCRVISLSFICQRIFLNNPAFNDLSKIAAVYKELLISFGNLFLNLEATTEKMVFPPIYSYFLLFSRKSPLCLSDLTGFFSLVSQFSLLKWQISDYTQ